MRLVFGIISLAVIVFAAASYVSRTGTDVVVVNGGTSTIHVRGALPAGLDSALSTVGVRLPDDLKPGVPTVVRVPSLSGDVSAAPGAISVTLLGQTMTFSAACDNLDFDGATLLGRHTNVDLGSRPKHDLRITCH